MGIEYLHIETYKGLVNKRLDDLGDVNILVGDNNTCKTTFLEAIWLGTSKQKDLTLFNIINSKHNGFKYENYISDFFGLFNTNEKRKFLNIVADYDKFTLDGIITRDEDGEYAFDGKIGIEKFYLSRKLNGIDLMKSPMYGQIESSKFVYASTQKNSVELNNQLSEYLLDSKSEILSLINSFDENIVDMQYSADKYTNKAILKLKHKKNGWLSIYNYGDGIRKVITIVSSLITIVRGGTLLIDEIETSLHVSALEGVYSWLIETCKKYDIQLFITTHSREALETLTEIGVEREDVNLVVYKLENYKNDIIIKRVDEDRAMSILEDGGDLR